MLIRRHSLLGAAGAASTLLNGIVAYWKLGEASGDALDSVNGYDGTVTLSPHGGTGIIGDCHDYGGASHVDCTNITALNGLTKITVSAWINQATPTSNRTIIAKWDYQTQGQWAIQTGFSSADEITVYAADILTDSGGHNMQTTNANISGSTWYHIVIVFDLTQAAAVDKAIIYVNNSIPTKTTNNGGSWPSIFTSASSSVKIAKFGGSLPRFMNGLIDEVGIWDRDLTSDEVAELYNSGSGLTHPFAA